MNFYSLLQEKGIKLNGKHAGSVKTVCPKCSEDRKHSKDLCLSVDIDRGIWNCHNCGFKGRVFEKVNREYVKPVPRLEKLSKKVIDWFEKRGISNNTLLRFNVTEAAEWMPQFEKEVPVICFNYLRGQELVNIKFRGANKSFKMAKDAELIFYNLSGIEGEETAVIVEGEIDCLSLHESGIYNSVSVPNGASKGSQRLEYLDNCWQYFEDKKKVVLMTDGDEAGISLREELARRIGVEKCYRVSYPENCKDANEVLVKHGKQAVAHMVENATEWPVEGIVLMDEMFLEIVDLYENGYPDGIKCGAGEFDEYLQLAAGQMTTVTGIPGSGKSEFVDWLMCLTAKNFKWPWGVFSFEIKPPIHVTKLLEKVTGKSFAFRKNSLSRIDQSEFDYGIGIVDKYFHFANTSFDFSIEAIIEKSTDLVKRRGIKGIVIDPWNWIEFTLPRGQSETSYINEALTKLQRFVKSYNVHCFLIAHPTKLKKEANGKYEVPTMYSISGSAHFFNKTDNGFSVYRDFTSGQVDVYIQKVKFGWLGKLGSCSYRYDTETRQYKGLNELQGFKNYYEKETF